SSVACGPEIKKIRHGRAGRSATLGNRDSEYRLILPERLWNTVGAGTPTFRIPRFVRRFH
ncbi:MAG: hypothetical protein KDJ78_15270, partial [Rhodobacteraceae bacterium]|nr:hypothetical protein [Paracoccaceae bacterium]